MLTANGRQKKKGDEVHGHLSFGRTPSPAYTGRLTCLLPRSHSHINSCDPMALSTKTNWIDIDNHIFALLHASLFSSLRIPCLLFPCAFYDKPVRLPWSMLPNNAHTHADLITMN